MRCLYVFFDFFSFPSSSSPAFPDDCGVDADGPAAAWGGSSFSLPLPLSVAEEPDGGSDPGRVATWGLTYLSYAGMS